MQNDDFMMLPVNNVLKDLESGNELFINLALSYAGSGAPASLYCNVTSRKCATCMQPTDLIDCVGKCNSKKGFVYIALGVVWPLLECSRSFTDLTLRHACSCWARDGGSNRAACHRRAGALHALFEFHNILLGTCTRSSAVALPSHLCWLCCPYLICTACHVLVHGAWSQSHCRCMQFHQQVSRAWRVVATRCRCMQFNQQLSEHCRKKAALCLRRVFAKLPPEAAVIEPGEWHAAASWCSVHCLHTTSWRRHAKMWLCMHSKWRARAARSASLDEPCSQ